MFPICSYFVITGKEGVQDPVITPHLPEDVPAGFREYQPRGSSRLESP